MGGGASLVAVASLTSCNHDLSDHFGVSDNPSDGGSSSVTVTSLTLDKANLRFVKTDLTAQTLTAEVTPSTATVTWTSSDETVATVDASGKVTPKKVGTTTITATAGDKTATSTVYIYDKIVDINTVSANVTVDDGEFWLINGNGTEVAYSITIGAGATVTLNGINIKPSGDDAGISCSGNATIILADGSTNTVDKTGNFYAAGIQVGGAGKTLTIEAETAGTGKLTAKGANNSKGGAGIGTNGAQYAAPTQTCGDIIIKCGIIDAQGGQESAGIGTGVANTDGAGIAMKQICGTITITGGTVTATGDYGAAGIGTGNADGTSSNSASQKCGAITIGAGVTSVTATKGINSPNSIGAGKKDDYGTQTCGTITIGGVVKAQSEFTGDTYTYPPAN